MRKFQCQVSLYPFLPFLSIHISPTRPVLLIALRKRASSQADEICYGISPVATFICNELRNTSIPCLFYRSVSCHIICPVSPPSLWLTFLHFHPPSYLVWLFFFICPFLSYLIGNAGSCTCLIATILAVKYIIQDVSTGIHRIHENRHMLVDLTQVSKSVIKQEQINGSGNF